MSLQFANTILFDLFRYKDLSVSAVASILAKEPWWTTGSASHELSVMAIGGHRPEWTEWEQGYGWKESQKQEMMWQTAMQQDDKKKDFFFFNINE